LWQQAATESQQPLMLLIEFGARHLVVSRVGISATSKAIPELQH
jgi:hypothetical protein